MSFFPLNVIPVSHLIGSLLYLNYKQKLKVKKTDTFDKSLTRLHISTKNCNINQLDKYLLLGDDPDIPDPNGNFPLHYEAINNCKIGSVILIENNTAVKVINLNGQTPYFLAEKYSHSNLAFYLL